MASDCCVEYIDGSDVKLMLKRIVGNVKFLFRLG